MGTNRINILAIESSCDETAAAIIANGQDVKAAVVASSVEHHQKYGGVVPEIASRAHIENIYPVLQDTLTQAGMSKDEIHAIAVANQPGLTIALIVGVTMAKALAFMWNKPLIAVNHIHAHLESALLEENPPGLPAVALVVSGGHTSLYRYESPLTPKLMGRTTDDAAGEAFDKVASILGLPYPGGPSIEKAAKSGDPKAIRFPRTLLGPDSLDFSFSGIKTSVLYHCCGQDRQARNRVSDMSTQDIADIAASFQAAVIDVLVTKTIRAAEQIHAKTILLGGGVAANTVLRNALRNACDQTSRTLLIAPRPYCTDNAVMIGALAYHKYKAGQFAELTLEAKATG